LPRREAKKPKQPPFVLLDHNVQADVAEQLTVLARFRQVGERFLHLHAGLEQAFREGTLTLESLVQRTAEIGSVEGELRATHLKYHLLTRPLLTDDQLVTYARLRGYPDEPATPQHTPGRHGNHGS